MDEPQLAAMSEYDAAVVGAGPNGLSAGLELARAGLRVIVFEAAETIGGGTRTAELTLPGFRHDVCSAVHPSGIASPFFNDAGLGVEWVHPPVQFSHPLGDGRAAHVERSVAATAEGLGDDGSRYLKLMGPLVERADDLIEDVLGPVKVKPSHLGSYARIAALGGMPASWLARRFSADPARAIFGGLSAHAIAPFNAMGTAAVSLMLGMIAHSHGWPVAGGGSQRIADRLADQIRDLDGTLETGHTIESLSELPADLALLDLMPPDAYRLARGSAEPKGHTGWRTGPGVFKIDWALSEPIPWADPVSGSAGTVHLGGTYEEIDASESIVFKGGHPEKPFVLLSQPSLFDATRAPAGKHTAWAYCHVPNGSTVDMSAAIESQVERFAPGFKDIVLARATIDTAGYQAYNPNFIGGDIGGGAYGLRKVLQIGSKAPYRLADGVYLCSSATPPGAGVHGMCGYHSARAALAAG
jgi:phytoene dehydrogenase-like protein